VADVWFSRIRSAYVSRAASALLALLVLGGAFDWGHAGGDDPDCNPVLVHHDHTAHHVAAAPATDTSVPEHCIICHSLRLLHTGLTATAAGVVTDTSEAGVTGVAVLALGATAVDGRTSRGPPALSL
jgi:hypothetical protein